LEDLSPPITLQQLAGAAERLARKERRPTAIEDWLALVEDTRDRLLREPFTPLPLDAFVSHDSGKERLLTVPRAGDRLLEEALVPTLRRAMASRLRPSVHGYRAGRSTFTAAAAFSTALARGFVYVATLDIARFYDSIDRARLHDALTRWFDARVVALLDALLAAPVMLRGHRMTSERGIPLGRPVSPLVANLYLVDLDDALATPDLADRVVYLRYADDLLVAARSPEDRARAVDRIRAALAALDLTLRDDKTALCTYDGTPIVYLGHAVAADGVYERVGDARLARIVQTERPEASTEGSTKTDPDDAQPNTRTQTLYVTENGLYLKIAQGMIVVMRGEQNVREVALHRVDRVMILSSVSFSSAFMASCIESRIPVLFFVGKGAAFGSLVSGGMPNPLRLRAQYDLAREPARRMALARSLVEAKIRAMTRRLTGDGRTLPMRERMAGAQAKLAEAGGPDVLRGLEGEATRAYYEGFALRIKPEGFAFKGRSRRPPKDPINSLMSFAYSLIFSEMQTALLAHGLDPSPALLHEIDRNHPALASDLIEPYRALIADTFVLSIVNNQQVDALKGFQRQGDGAVYMTRETRRDVLDAYERFMHRPAGGARGSGNPRRLLHAAARSMLRVVLGESAGLTLPLTDGMIDDDDSAMEEVFV